MIRVQIGGDAHDVDVDANLRWRVEEKIGGLDRYMYLLEDGVVALSWARAGQGVLLA